MAERLCSRDVPTSDLWDPTAEWLRVAARNRVLRPRHGRMGCVLYEPHPSPPP
jgi:hypothetical protein